MPRLLPCHSVKAENLLLCHSSWHVVIAFRFVMPGLRKTQWSEVYFHNAGISGTWRFPCLWVCDVHLPEHCKGAQNRAKFVFCCVLKNPVSVTCRSLFTVSGQGCKLCVGFLWGCFVCVYFCQFNLLLLMIHIVGLKK